VNYGVAVSIAKITPIKTSWIPAGRAGSLAMVTAAP